MRSQIIRPEPPPDEVQLTLTIKEASALKKILNKVDGHARVLKDFKDALINVSSYQSGVTVRYTDGLLTVSDHQPTTRIKEEEW